MIYTTFILFFSSYSLSTCLYKNSVFLIIFTLCQGDGTGFGQSSDAVMLITPERLNAAVNGSDPLECLWTSLETCGDF